MRQRNIKTYSELIKLPTFIERFNYLKIGGVVGEETFGFDRYLNQVFYKSKEWLSVRRKVIIRDNGCDLAMIGHEIPQGISVLIHHMNPISKEDILNRTDFVLNPEYLITTILNTHNAIHYGNSELLVQEPVIRFKNDTCPWKK